jgi:lipopolysaccharide export system protein LptC
VAQATQYQTAQGPGGAPSAKGVSPAAPPRLSGRNSYSIFVGFMKVLLPALAVALILLVVIWPQLGRDDSRFRIRVSDISLEQADSLSMLNARFEGVDDHDQPFVLTADEATQTADDDNLVHLELPKGDMTLKDGTWLAMTAREGRYKRDTQVLELSGEVTLFHDQGFELRTEAARIDLDAGTAWGSEPVEGQGPFGNLVSEGFRVLDRGERIVFIGRSRAVFHPDTTQVEQ